MARSSFRAGMRYDPDMTASPTAPEPIDRPYHPISESIEGFLREKKVWYERFEHDPVRTSEEAARVRGGEYSLSDGAKSLIVKGKRSKGPREFFMIVVRGSDAFDKRLLRDATGYTDVRFATPEEVSRITNGVLPGGVPPWGNLFGLQVFADEALLSNERMIFNAGDRRVSIAMRTEDYIKLVSPVPASIAERSLG